MREEGLVGNNEGDSDEDGATRALSQQLTLVVFDTAEPGKKERRAIEARTGSLQSPP